jgi:putative transposase
MPNHVHLLLTPEDVDSVSHFMKHLGQRYVQHFNRRYARSGSLWEGRFKSSIVDAESYLFRCYRYIELNPVRAGMVSSPRDYSWSSYRANAGHEPSLVLDPHRLFLNLGCTEAERVSNYRALFRDELSPSQLEEIRGAARGGFALGRPEFVARIEGALQTRAVAGVPGRPRKRGLSPV